MSKRPSASLPSVWQHGWECSTSVEIPRLTLCLVLTCAGLLFAACGADDRGSPRVLGSPNRASLRVERVVSADLPAAFAFSPVDGQLWYGELQNGRIFSGGSQRWDFAVSTGGESGLQSITISPDGHHLFVYLSVPTGDPQDPKSDGGEGQVSRVVRLSITSDGSLSDPRTILEVPSTGIHNAGTVGFGPEGALYVNIGDNHDFGESQDLASPFGKILRITSEGTSYPGNPFIGRQDADPRVWAYGIRNTSAFSWLPDGRMIGADNGDTGDDEINVLEAGANYGWPPAELPRSGETAPTRVFRETIAPAGLARAPAYFSWSRDDVLVCGFVSRKMVLADTADPAATPQGIVDGCSLRVVLAPDGSVVFSNEHGIWRLILD